MNQPFNNPDTPPANPTMFAITAAQPATEATNPGTGLPQHDPADARRMLLREIGDDVGPPVQRAVEDKAHAAGISWKDIDRARVAGGLYAHWFDIRDAPDVEDKMRYVLLRIVRTYAGFQRDVIAIDALADQAGLHRGPRSIEPVTSAQEFEQFDRNLHAFHKHVENLAGLIDLAEEETATIRGVLDNWDFAISDIVNRVGTSAELKGRWHQFTDPWLESMTNYVAGSLRHQPSADAEPLLPLLDSARTRARHAAHAHLNPDHAQPGPTPAAASTAALPAPETIPEYALVLLEPRSWVCRDDLQTDNAQLQAGSPTADSIRAAMPTAPAPSSSAALHDGASTSRPPSAGVVSDTGASL